MREAASIPAPRAARRGRPWRFIVLLALGVGLGAWAWSAFRGAEEEPLEILTVSLGDAVYRTEATGRIVPREEVFVRSLVAGQLVELRARPGQFVKRGTHLATVRVVADPVTLGEARAQVRVAERRLETASRELQRLKPLKTGIALSARELAKAEDDEQLARTELESVTERSRMIAEGVSNAESGRSTRIVATIDGVVLATPVAVGDFVSEMNSYRDGTTIAVLADMNNLLFKGQIEEAHVGKLALGMPATVRVGAMPGVRASGKITWIAPRATIEHAGAVASAPSSSGTPNTIAPLTSSTSGITRFELWVELLDSPANMRAGYTASAELTLESREHVPVVDERVLRFDGGKVFARVHGKEGRTEEREVKVGVSDGIKVEIVSGLVAGERIVAFNR